MTDCLIQASGLSKDYHDGQRTLHVLSDLEFSLNAGEVVSIIGPSGCGKSTLLSLLGGLDKPTAGKIELDGLDIAEMGQRQLNKIRREKVGFIFQFHHLLPELHAWENVAMPLWIAGASRKEGREKAEELLRKVGLGDRMNHIPGKLSGGEQQRVSLARALVHLPRVVFADEPTGNLDTEMGMQVIDMLWQMTRDQGRSLVLVTHEEKIAKKADRVLKLENGVLVQQN